MGLAFANDLTRAYFFAQTPLGKTKGPSPRLVMISNCGFPERFHFQVVSHWVERAALNMRTEVVGEIYATQGGLLTAQIEDLQPVIFNYLQLL